MACKMDLQSRGKVTSNKADLTARRGERNHVLTDFNDVLMNAIKASDFDFEKYVQDQLTQIVSDYFSFCPLESRVRSDIDTTLLVYTEDIHGMLDDLIHQFVINLIGLPF